MKFSFEIKTHVAIEKIWSLYENVNKWFTWENDLEDISLSGDFVQGTHGTMKLQNQPSMAFELVSVVPNREFTDKTFIPNAGNIYFIHQLIQKDTYVIVKHSVEFIPNDREATIEDAQFVSQIFSDVPASIFSLVKAAEDEC
ncbi:hypothetical protein ACSMFR_05825 [Listeria aquatica]|uniref:hypothetical protein n=1 Tax=Listeria aquatica TaxID=1494960 RepID=UPI003F722A44